MERKQKKPKVMWVTANGQAHRMDNVQDDLTFKQLKNEIQYMIRIPAVEQQLLTEGGAVLDDNETIQSWFGNSYRKVNVVPLRKWTNHQEDLAKIGDIYEMIESTFCCGGFIDGASTRIFFSDKATGDHHISFPNCSKEALELLKQACTPSTFGKGQQTVLDPNYRNALSLFPPEFAISIHPSEFDILTRIQQLMVPNVKEVQAELYQLNVYGEGSHFKSHVDTPRGANMIGSLVLSLPCFHEGGQLIVRKGRKSEVFDFSHHSSSDKFVWVAFFADCEHEILEVTKGCRITVTYLLKSIAYEEVTPTIQTCHVHVIQNFQRLMADTSFFPQGKTLVFGCLHAYANDAIHRARKNPTSALKGADSILYSSLTAAGLDVSFCGIFELQEEDEEDYSRTVYWVSHEMPSVVQVRVADDQDEFVKETFPGFQMDKNFTWCTRRKATQWLAAVTASYGNGVSANSIYVEAVLLVRLPPSRSLARQWRILRLLWIGKLKNEESVCHLARCPTQIIQSIMKMYLEAKTSRPRSRSEESESESESEEIVSDHE